MEMKEFIKNFSDQFDESEVAEFQIETKFKELNEWSSLTALSLIAMVDEEYNIRITGDDIRNSNTINDLFNLIKAKSN